MIFENMFKLATLIVLIYSVDCKLRLPTWYNWDEPPNKTVHVNLSIYFDHFEKFDGRFDATIFVTQSFLDSRLQRFHSKVQAFDALDYNNLWIPNFSIGNTMKVTEVQPRADAYGRLHPDGTVVLRKKFNVSLRKCRRVRIPRYMSTQCDLSFQSFKYNRSVLSIKWSNNPISFAPSYAEQLKEFVTWNNKSELFGEQFSMPTVMLWYIT